MSETVAAKSAEQLDVPLDRDLFLRTLIRELSGHPRRGGRSG